MTTPPEFSRECTFDIGPPKDPGMFSRTKCSAEKSAMVSRIIELEDKLKGFHDAAYSVCQAKIKDLEAQCAVMREALERFTNGTFDSPYCAWCGKQTYDEFQPHRDDCPWAKALSSTAGREK